MNLFKTIKSKDIKRYINEALSTASPSTVDRKLSSLKNFFSWAKETGIAKENPIDDLAKKNIPQAILPTDQIRERIVIKGQNRSLKSLLTAKYADNIKAQRILHLLFEKRPKWFRRYQKTSASVYVNYALIVIIFLALGFGVYDQFFAATKLPQAFPSTPERPKRYLSFQGRLTNQYNTPLTTAHDITFKLWNHTSDTTEVACDGGGDENCLWSSSTCSVTPNQDGIFNVLLGTTSGEGYTCSGASEIASDTFSENSEVWLGMTVEAETMTSRVQIATVAYALNAETLQGYPIDATGSATKSTVVTMNQWGGIVLGETGPRIRSVSGTFAIEGEALTLQTVSDGDINLAPNGTGSVNITSSATTDDALYVLDAQTTDGAVIHGYYSGAGTTQKLIHLGSGASETDRFWVNSSGIAYVSGKLGIGTTNPTQELHVVGNMRLTGFLYDTNNETGSDTQILSKVAGGVDWVDSSSLPAGNADTLDTLDSTDFLRATDSDTFEGINTRTLTLQSLLTGNRTANLINITQANDVTYNLTSGALLAINQLDTGSAGNAMHITNAGTGFTFRADDESADTTPFVIDNGGNVGIGTTGPGTKLDISDTTNVTMRLSSTKDASNWVPDTDYFGILDFYSGDTTAPGVQSRAQIVGSPRLSDALGAGGVLLFKTAPGTPSVVPQTRMIIGENGNVGIGTTSPGAKLEVAGGNIKINGATSYLDLVDAGDASGIDILLKLSDKTAEGYASGFSRASGNEFFNLVGGSTGASIFSGGVDADTKRRIKIRAGGDILMGDGTNNPDVYLGRDGTSSLRVSSDGLTGVADLIITGNVGIGTTGPVFQIHNVQSGQTGEASSVISTAAQLSSTIATQGDGQAYFLGRDITNDIEFIMGTSINGGAFAGAMTSHDFWLRTNNADRLTIKATTGNVGIGTTNPGTLLQLGTAGTTAGVLSLAGATSGLVTVDVAAAAGTWSLTLPINDGDSNQVLATDGSGNTSWTAVSSLPAGDADTLDTLDSTDFLRATDSDTFEGINTRTLTLQSLLTAGNRTANLINITQANDATYNLTSGALLAINQLDTGSAGNAMHITNAGTGFTFRADDESADTTPFVIDGTGNVGIGDTSPASMLTVGNGDLFQVNSSGIIAAIDNVAHTIDDVSGDLTLTSNSTSVDIADNLTIQGTTGLTFDTGAGGDITFAYGEKIDNDTDGTILLTATTAKTSGNLEVAGTTGLTFSGAGGDITFTNAEKIDNDVNGTIAITADVTSLSGDIKLTGADILDTNSNEFLRFSSTASAVDELTIGNAATGGIVTIAATGGDTDIVLSIDSKGADALNLNGTATGDVNIAGGSGSTGCTIENSTGNLVCTGTVSGSGIVATSLPFSGLTSATNTTAAMVVGAGASLNYTSTGTINASSLIGATWIEPGAIGTTTPAAGNFTTIGVTTQGSGAFTTLSASGAIAANGGITFDAATDTIGAHTLSGTLDANTNIITNIGNTGTDFVASTGALNLAGVLTMAANAGITMTSGTGQISQTYTGTTTDASTLIANSLTSGDGYNISSSGTAFTGNLIDVTLSGSNAANTGSLLALTNSGTANTNTSLYIKHYATGTGNLAMRVDDESSDTSPFVIDGAGNVGIGTTNPTYKLQTRAVTAVGSVSFTGTGLNDATSGGTFTGSSALNYKVEIDLADTTDTFKWSDDGGSTWDATGVAITGSAQTLNNGVTITFAATTGHTLTDYWEFSTTVSNPFLVEDESGNDLVTILNSGLVRLGDAATVSFAEGDGDLYIEDELEVDGAFYPTGGLYDEGGTLALSLLDGEVAYFPGEVGIGTTAPSTGLHLYGTSSDSSTFTIDRSAGNYGPGIKLAEAGTVNWQIKQDADGNNNDTLQFAIGNDSVMMTIQQGGNVGIGDTSPASLFTVGDGDDFRINTTGDVGIGVAPSSSYDIQTAGDVYLQGTNYLGTTSYYVNTSGNANFLDVIAADTGNPGLTVGNGTTGYIKVGGSTISDAAGDLTLDSDSGEVYIPDELGIGITNPGQKLDVLGNARIQQTAANSTSILYLNGTGDTTAAYIRLRDSDAGVNWYLENSSGSSNMFRLESYDGADWRQPFKISASAPTNTLYLNSSGNVGIGTTAPYTKLTIGSTNVGGAGNGISVGDTASIDLRVGQSTTNNVSLGWTYNATAANAVANLSTWGGNNALGLQIGGGNVGIGTTSPSASLDVEGSTLEFSNTGIIFQRSWGGSTDLNWKKAADISLTTGSYRAVTFEVEYLDTNSNHGHTSNLQPMLYYVTAYRSGAVQDDQNTGTVSGPIADFVRLVKTSTGVYELQVRQDANHRTPTVKIRITDSAGATVTWDEDLPNGSTTGTIYTATTIHTDYATNFYAAGVIDANSYITLDDDDGYIRFGELATGEAPTCNNTNNGVLLHNRDSGEYGSFFYCREDNVGNDSYVKITAQTGTPDIAEYVPVLDHSVEGGDIVSVLPEGSYNDDNHYNRFYAGKATEEDPLLGVISEDPGIIVNESADPNVNLNYNDLRPLTIGGRTPVKIATKEKINKGEPISASSIPGLGQKAQKPGQVVGKSLTSFNPQQRTCQSVANPDDASWDSFDVCYKLPDGTYLGKVLVYVENSWYQPQDYLAEVVNAEKIRASEVETETLIVRDINVYETIKEIQLVLEDIKNGANISRGLFVETSAEVLGTLTTGAIEAGSITADGFTVFEGTVDNLLVQAGLVSPTIQTGLISPLADGESIKFGLEGQEKITVENNGEEVASIDAEGNAEFDGSLNVEKDATVEGELHAGKIIADEIVGRDGLAFKSTAGETGVTLEEIENMLREAEEDQNALDENENWIDPDASYASLTDLNLENLFVTGSAAMNSLSLSTTLTVGPDLVVSSSIDEETGLTINNIDSLSAPLKLQALAMAPLEIMSGLFKINTNGNVEIEGNLYVAGRIESEGLTLNEAEESMEKVLSVRDRDGLETASIEASGSAQFTDLKAGKLIVAGSSAEVTEANSEGEVETNSPIGQARLIEGEMEIVINNASISEKTLVYITPTTSTQNKVLFVKSKEPGKFTVGISSPATKDIEFNWWIVETEE